MVSELWAVHEAGLDEILAQVRAAVAAEAAGDPGLAVRGPTA